MEVIGRHNKLNRSEEKVLNWLELGLKDVEGKILVEPGFRKYKYQEWPDFVLISKTHGILIIECKGLHPEEIYEVSNTDLVTRNGTDRYGKQLASYGCIFKSLLKNKNVNVSKFAIFPNILSTDPVASAILEFNPKPSDVTVLFNEYLDWPCDLDYLGAPRALKKMPRYEFEEILNLVNPTRIISYDLTLPLEKIHQSLKILDDRQSEFIHKMNEGHHLINGLPGTGKTLLLVQIAEREIAMGKDVLYTCFNVPLNRTIKDIFGHEVCRTFQNLFYKLAKDNDADSEVLSDFNKRVSFLLTRKLEAMFDVILVDEYQDLDDDEIQIIVKLLRPQGLLVLGGDRLQSIRNSRESWKSLGVHIVGHSYFLEKPYRTHPEVVDFALAFISTDRKLEREAKSYFADHEFIHAFSDFEILKQKVKFWLKSHKDFLNEVCRIQDLNAKAKILIMTPTLDHKKDIIQLESKNIRIETFQRMKGLEADIVILYGLDDYLHTPHTAYPMTDLQKMRSVFSGLCRSRGVVYLHGFSPNDFYFDLFNIFQTCLKKKTA